MTSYKKSTLSLVDEIGILYISNCRVLRAIHDSSVSEVSKLLNSGLLDELIMMELFPKTQVADVDLPGYTLVLEHEKIEPAIYPFEWSPEMLRRAALCVLQVNECANRYGYELKDAHPYNVIFKYNKPLFVDFGSFVQTKTPEAWIAYNEFLGAFYYPLLLRTKQLTRLYKHMYLIGGITIGPAELATILNPFFRMVGVRNTARLLAIFDIYRRGQTVTDDKINARFKHPVLNFLAKIILKSKYMPFKKVKTQNLAIKIKRMNLQSKSQWAEYHQQAGFYSGNGNIKLSERMFWIKEIVVKLRPKTILELAGNQGILSRTLSKIDGVERVICADYDENSVDALVLNLINNERLSMACFNFMGESWQILANERQERLRSELVIALAVTHHLILTQRYDIDRIFNTLASYTSKYLIVEFMPLGLWDGESAPPLPSWYNESWFVDNLCNYFSVLERRELEQNRIAFVAILK